jgi:hypothetical protein
MPTAAKEGLDAPREASGDAARPAGRAGHAALGTIEGLADAALSGAGVLRAERPGRVRVAHL